ncbi:MAG: hypothetical protein ABIW03_06975, partial [Sphingomicrobium sp.]
MPVSEVRSHASHRRLVIHPPNQLVELDGLFGSDQAVGERKSNFFGGATSRAGGWAGGGQSRCSATALSGCGRGLAELQAL